MANRRSRSIVLAVVLGGTGALFAPAGAEASRPDVLLITVDTLRPDALGWIGGSNSTPAIDALAASGFRFPRAVAPAPLSVVCFRARFAGRDPAEADRRNEALMEAVNGTGEAYLSHTRLRGRTVLRAAVGNIHTEERHLRRAFELLQREARRLAS